MIRIPRCLALLGALALFASAGARAGTPDPGEKSVGRIDVPASVSAGDVVALRWRDLPSAVEEMELLLSLDGGRSWPLRVTPELEGHARGVRWTVPDLPCGRARLMLRIGGERGERTGALSAEFEILHAAGAPAPDLGYREGPFWPEPRPEGAPPSRLSGDRPGYGEPGDPPLAAAPTPLPARTGGRAACSDPAPAGAPQPAGSRGSAPPRRVPLRI